MRLPVWLVSTSLILFSICSNGQQNETEPNQGPAGNSVRVFGANLHYVDAGSGSVVGNSLGGWIAANFALAHPERIDRLVLCDAAGYAALGKNINARTLSALRLASRDDIRYLGPLTFHDKRFYEDVDLAFKQRVTAGDGYTIDRVVDSIIRNEDVLDGRLGAIRKPTLIVWGRDDKLIPLSFAERFHKEIAN